jgi:hypothetical protein
LFELEASAATRGYNSVRLRCQSKRHTVAPRANRL